MTHRFAPTDAHERDTIATYIARQALGGLTTEEAAGFEAWLDETPERRALHASMRATWRSDALTAACVQIADASPAPRRTRLSGVRRLAGRQWPIWAAAAAAAALVIAVVPGVRPSSPAPRHIITTVAARTEPVELADGSQVALNARTQIAVRVDHRQRRAALRHGAAHFDIATDARPFVVDAGAVEIEVLGTVFTVDRWRQGVTITILEGQVRVSTPLETLELAAGEGLRVRASGSAETFRFDPDTHLDWRTDWVIADGMGWNEFIAKLQRHAPYDIDVDDVLLADKRVNGRFRLSQTDATLTLVAELYGLELQREEGVVRLRPRIAP